MSEVYDVVVIGAGPAGLAAARVAGSDGARVALVDKMGPGGQLMNIGEVHDFATAAPGQSGPDLIGPMVDAALAAGVEMLVDEVVRVEGGRTWRVSMLDEAAEARVIIVATGLSPGTTGLLGENELEGRGLSHCAVCDGPLYAGKPVVVAGSDRWAVTEACLLGQMASEVMLVAEPDALTTGNREALGRVANLRVIEGRLVALGGGDGLDHVLVEAAGDRTRFSARGLFAFTNRRPATGFLDKVVARTGAGFLPPETATASGAGLFACGDVRAGAEETIAEAIADGERAGHNARQWLASRGT